MEVINKFWAIFVLLSVTVIMARRRQWALGALLVLILWLLFLWLYISTHYFRLQYLTLVCVFSIAYLMVKDGKTKGDESVFCKYNIFYKNNKVPKKLSIFLLVLALVVSVLRVVMILIGKGNP